MASGAANDEYDTRYRCQRPKLSVTPFNPKRWTDLNLEKLFHAAGTSSLAACLTLTHILRVANMAADCEYHDLWDSLFDGLGPAGPI